jgi:uncharacterized protein YjbI with pentapeptide repeats
MANDEHVAILKKGVDAWNAWRDENPDIRPDLSRANLRLGVLVGADLCRADLRGADLSGTNLDEANLSRADLTSANLDKVDLTSANLSKANLRGADLTGANLIGADLRGADLSEASLIDASASEVDLSKANLSAANLSGARLARAKLRDADLTGAYLRGANLGEANLTGANLRGADLFEAGLSRADLRETDPREASLIEARLFSANLSRANLSMATLFSANLGGADLTGANLSGANLSVAHLFSANLGGAALTGANLESSILVKTDFTGADLTGCRIHGVSAWRLKLDGAKQQNLVITSSDEPTVTVDNIEVAQFIYLLLHNEKIRDVIDTIGKKGVLLLGRFTEGRMVVLESLREKLRDLGFVPMVFNFDKPETKDFTETVRLLCNLSHFVIVDITNPRSAPLELQATVPDYMVPFVPILQQGEQPFSMFVDLQNKYDWVLQPVVGYSSVDRLIEVLEDKVVRPAEAKFNELLARRTNQLRVENV